MRKKLSVLLLIIFFIINITSCYSNNNTWVENTIKKLYASQNNDGGYKESFFVQNRELSSTYYFLEICSLMDFPLDNDFKEKTLKWILSTQKEAGYFGDEKQYSRQIQNTHFAVLSLKKLGYKFDEKQIQKISSHFEQLKKTNKLYYELSPEKEPFLNYFVLESAKALKSEEKFKDVNTAFKNMCTQSTSIDPLTKLFFLNYFKESIEIDEELHQQIINEMKQNKYSFIQELWFLSFLEDDNLNTTIKSTLLKYFNLDGGFSAIVENSSSDRETFYALQTLKRLNYNMPVLERNMIKNFVFAHMNAQGGFNKPFTSPSTPQATYKSLNILTKLGYDVKNPDNVEIYLKRNLQALMQSSEYHPLVMLNTLKALELLNKNENAISIVKELDQKLYRGFIHNTYQSLEEKLGQDFELMLYDISSYIEILVMLDDDIPDNLKQKLCTNCERVIEKNLELNTITSIVPIYYSAKLLDNINIISSYNEQINSFAKRILNEEINKEDEGDLLISYYAMMTQKYNHVLDEPLFPSSEYLNHFKSDFGGIVQNSDNPSSLSMTEKYIQMTSLINNYRMKALTSSIEGYGDNTMHVSVSDYKLRRFDDYNLILLKLYNAEHSKWNKYYLTDGKTNIPGKIKISNEDVYNDIVVFQIPKGMEKSRLFFYFSENGYTEVPF